MWKNKIIIYILIAFIPFIGGVFGTWYYYQGKTSKYQRTIDRITKDNKILTDENKAAREYNKQLTETIGKYKSTISEYYNKIGEGLSSAESNNGEIAGTIDSAEEQIQRIITAVGNLIKELGEFKDIK